MSFKYVVLFVFMFDATCDGKEDILNVPEDLLSFQNLVTKYGHTVEQHYVTTEDGYILTVFNIPGNKSNPLILAHGVFDASTGFFLRGHRSLGSMAAENGYDVWMMNNRGNRFSRNHTTLNPDKDVKFWDYSAHEFGVYDLPTVIDYVLEETGQKQVSIVGFSEGTTSVFVLGSMLPEYNEKVKIFVALAPVAYLEHVRSGLFHIIKISPLIDLILPKSVQEISGYNSFEKAFLNLLCTQLPISYELCYQGGMNSVSGPDSNGIERKFFSTILEHFPAGTSRKNLMHFAKISLLKSFCQYDYGAAENMKMYNSVKPPVYDLSKVTMRIVAMSGTDDPVSTIQDAEKLLGDLPNVVGYKVVNGSNHLEFMWGRHAPESTYGYVFDVLKEYN